MNSRERTTATHGGSRGHAAVDNELATGAIGAGIGGRPGHKLGHCFGAGFAAQRDQTLNPGPVGFAVVIEHGCIDNARVNRVDSDVVWRKLDCCGPTHATDGPLAGSVRELSTHTPGRPATDEMLISDPEFWAFIRSTMESW